MRLTWDDVGTHYFKIGIDRGVLYPYVDDAYEKGVSWSGLTGIEYSFSGREKTALYTGGVKSRILLTPEEFGGTINAFYYPDEFERCMGNAIDSELDGLVIGQQEEMSFGITYRTRLGNDASGADFAYQIHFVYGAIVTGVTDANSTVNASADLTPMSWTFDTIPEAFNGYSPVSHLFVDSRKFSAESMNYLETAIWGSENSEPYLPMLSEIQELLWLGVPYDGRPRPYGLFPSGEIFPMGL